MLRNTLLVIVLFGIVGLAGCGSNNSDTGEGTDTTAPTIPTNLIATAVSSTQIDLSWDASTDDTNVTGYRMYRGGAEVATTTDTNYSDSGLTASTTYSFTVTAYDVEGNESVQSNFVSVTTQVSSGTISNRFPPYENTPALTSYVSGGTFNNTYYISTNGNDSTGDGSIGNPWASLNGARTGGMGNSATPGDLIYFRGGTYIATENNNGWRDGYYYFDIDGTASDYIVFSAYLDETPIFESIGDGITSLQIKGDYVVIDSLNFTTGSLVIGSNAQYNVIQNNVFDGDPYDPPGDQLNDAHLYLYDTTHNTIIRNNYFASNNAHAIKTYSSSGMPANVIIEYNTFYEGSVSYGLVAFKAAITNYTIRYNKFENISSDCISIGSSYTGNHTGLNIHHNVFDGCSGSILTKLGTASTGEVQNLNFFSNVIFGATSGDRDVLELDCNDGCLTGANNSLGEFYDNTFYDLVDLIDPETASDFTNYPSYWNYNAYPGVVVRNSAENQNNLSSSSWQDSALIQPNHGISRGGEAGNRFYTIGNDSLFIGAGRYGDNIGGFTFGSP